MLSRSLVFMLVGLMAWPALGRWTVACADGTPCEPARVADSAQECCPPVSCHVPIDPQRCIVKSTPGLDRTPPGVPLTVAPLLPLAVLEIAPPPVAPAPIVTLAVKQERPPNQPPPKQGRAPRSPPSGA